MRFATDFAVGIGRREGFRAMTGREATSAQDIGFFGGVAGMAVSIKGGVGGGVIGSEDSAVGFAGVIGDVSINAGSLGGGVAGGVSTAVGVVSAVIVILAGSAFGVEGGVGIAVSLGVGIAISLGVAVGCSLETLFAGFAGFF